MRTANNFNVKIISKTIQDAKYLNQMLIANQRFKFCAITIKNFRNILTKLKKQTALF